LSWGYFFNFDKLAYIRVKKGGCILCGLVKKNPATAELTVYHDSVFVVSLNLYPYNPGHLLIFPRKHMEDIRQFTREETSRLNELTNYFLDILDYTHKPRAYNIGYNMGLPAGASIKHIHLHIIPRYPNEVGISDLIAGKRVLVENPLDTARKLKERITHFPFSISTT
jgi:ATP adenylyltransferase